MQERSQAINKCKEMLVDVQQKLVEEIKYMLDSGYLNLEEYDNDYRLPKILLCAALCNVARGYSPIDKKDSRQAKALGYTNIRAH